MVFLDFGKIDQNDGLQVLFNLIRYMAQSPFFVNITEEI